MFGAYWCFMSWCFMNKTELTLGNPNSIYPGNKITFTKISTFHPLQQEKLAFQVEILQHYCLPCGSCKHDQAHNLSMWMKLNNGKHS